jgi:hypothetical protein
LTSGRAKEISAAMGKEIIELPKPSMKRKVGPTRGPRPLKIDPMIIIITSEHKRTRKKEEGEGREEEKEEGSQRQRN